ncbi:MAG TPA: class I adenylate-forming enzyme family protein [Parvularculaceae bacterium]|nr:class I adenylate-forming enzyme family protein [Parvularculaceae bacterium]
MSQAAYPTTEQIAASAYKLLVENPLFKIGEATIRGNAYRVFENAPPSLVGLFLQGATYGEKEFLYYEDETWTHAKLWSESCRLANALSEGLGVKQGDRVAIAMRNYPEWCAAYMAIISLGAVAVPLNAWWKGAELRYALKDSDARIAFVDDKRLDYISPFKDDLGLTLIAVRTERGAADYRYADLLGKSPSDATPTVDIKPDDDFAIYYTSGSTGNPKGVILTHRGALSTLFSWSFVAMAIKDARGGVSLFGDDPGILLGIPLFHVTGSHAIFMLSWIAGRRMAVMYRWDAELAVDLINKYRLTNFVGVPSQSYELIDAAGSTPMPTLVDIGSGGAKRPPEQVKKLKQKFSNANPSSGYGLTETNAAGCVISLADYQKRPDSTGRALPPVTDIKIVGRHGDCAAGEVGEVWIRSAANFRGYLNLPEDTARAITPDGWFRTGDVGRLDEEGFLYIVDRIKDLIIRGGENISCLEVEARAYQHPAVAQAIVFSVPDETLGERVGLVFYPKEGASLDPKELRDFMSGELAGFKLPERIWLSPGPLLKLGTEKFDKQTIRRLALQHPPAWSA